jgi:D-amino peptidase
MNMAATLADMKIYISVDIEGVAGITHWDEAEKKHPDYDEFRRQMTAEANAAIEGAFAAGASEVLVKDAHDSGRNLLIHDLDPRARLIRSWAGHPLCMVQELDDSFDAVLMVGYHAAAGSEENSLAHTLSLQAARITINGIRASETTIHALASSMLGVPTVFVSGDKGLMDEIAAFNPAITRCAVKEGRGQSTISLSPRAACNAIRKGAEEALRGDRAKCLITLPPSFEVAITYANPVLAYRHRWYPGCRADGERTIRFETADYFDVLRLLNYVT